MNITFLIGNGFDLGLGLKTKFSDFLPIYLKTESKNFNILKFKEEIRNKIENWSDFELQLGAYTEEFGAEDWEKFIEQKRDFEKQFMKYLKQEQAKVKYDTNDLNFFAKGLYFFEKSNILRDRPLKLVKSEISNRDIIFNFINFNYTDTLIRIVVNVFRQNLIKNQKRSKGSTDRDRIGDFAYVHGSIDKSPIIGVDNKMQIKNPDFAKNIDLCEMLVKHDFDKMIQRDFEEDAEKIIDNSDIICVYGMSLGETDTQWWQYLLDWLINADYRQLIIFNWDNKYIDDDYGWQRKYKKLRNHILDITGYKGNINQSNVERIHFAINKNIFECDMVNNKNEIQDSNVIKEFNKEEQTGENKNAG